MSAYRRLTEHYRSQLPMMTDQPCPDCGLMMPAVTDEDHAKRRAHFKVCLGKPQPFPLEPTLRIFERPQPVEAINHESPSPMIISDLDVTKLEEITLVSLVCEMAFRLLPDSDPAKRAGINAILQPAYQFMHDAAQAELSRRRGDHHNG